jgi:hypothetical protein
MLLCVGLFSWHGLGPLVESMPRHIKAVLAARGGLYVGVSFILAVTC